MFGTTKSAFRTIDALAVAFLAAMCGAGCHVHLHYQERHYHEMPQEKANDDSQREYDELLKRMEDARDENDHTNGQKQDHVDRAGRDLHGGRPVRWRFN